MTKLFIRRTNQIIHNRKLSFTCFIFLFPLLSIAVPAYALEAPRNLHCTDTGASATKWSWEAVPGAIFYDVIVDNVFQVQTRDTFFESTNLGQGSHSLVVKGIGDNWNYSDKSADFTCQVGDTSDSRAPQVNDTGLVDPQSWSYNEVYEKPGYQLVFSDEFNESALNPNRWNTQLRWDGSFNGERYEYRTVNGEDQFYVNTLSQDQGHLDLLVPTHSPFEFDGSRLAIRAKRNPLQTHEGSNGHGPLDNMLGQQAFMSGAITTYDKFSRKYGYFEARMKIPSQLGTFPAFWLHHQNRESEGTQRTEIDIMENLGHAPWYIYNSFHYFTGVAEGVTGTPNFIKPQPEGQIYTGTDYSEDYHVYAVEWEPGYLKYMIDGQKVSELWNGNVNHEELYLIINLAVGGHWTNYPTNAGGTGRESGNHFPTQEDKDNWGNPALEIDYVRVFGRE